MQRIRYQTARVELALNDSSGSPATCSAEVARPRMPAAPKTEPKSKGIAFDAKGHEERSTKLTKFNI